MFIEIDSQNAFDRFLSTVDYLHDAILREIGVLARGYVDSELRMFGDADPYDARLVFQVQSAHTPCVEIIFIDVEEIAIRPAQILSPSGRYTDGEITLILGEIFSGAFLGVRAKGMKYRILDHSFLGVETIAVDLIPAEHTGLGLDAGDGWVQCPSCSNLVHTMRFKRTVKCEICTLVLEVPDR